MLFLVELYFDPCPVPTTEAVVGGHREQLLYEAGGQLGLELWHSCPKDEKLHRRCLTYRSYHQYVDSVVVTFSLIIVGERPHDSRGRLFGRSRVMNSGRVRA